MAEDSKSGEENELVLELSIGGIFGNSKKTNGNLVESVEKDNQIGGFNVESKREIQALRRRELRRKREEKLKKSLDIGSSGSVSGPFMENKEWLQSQIAQQIDDVSEIEPALKKEKIGIENIPENACSVSQAPVTNGFENQKRVVVRIDEEINTKSNVSRPTTCRSFRPYNMNLKPNEDETEGGGRRPAGVSNGSTGCASSTYSDGQRSSDQGGATEDSRSNSSNSQLDRQRATTSTASYPSDQPTGSSKQTVSTDKPTDSTVSEPSLVKPNDQPNPHGSSLSNQPSKPEANKQHQKNSFLARMPCVSTTGNGPNGKTVSGFLYRYSKNDVSIVCVCHGRLFSPAGFVEHAGGVDIVHPLKHITIFPTAFASS